MTEKTDSAFADYKFRWKGMDYVIPAKRVMMAIARVEVHVTMPELHHMLSDPKNLRFASLAMGYTALLSFVGVTEEVDDVYVDLFPGGDNSEDRVQTAVGAIMGLMQLMVPQKALKEFEAKARKQAEAETATDVLVDGKKNRRARRAEASSSNRRIKQPAVGV